MMVIDYLVVGMLAAGLLISTSRILKHGVQLYSLQSIFLAGIGFAEAWGTAEKELLLAGVLTLVIKGIAIPAVLLTVLKKVGIKKEIESVTSKTWSLLISFALIVICFNLVPQGMGGESAISELALPAAVSLLVLGLMLMILRRQAILQIVGLMLMENGVYLAALAVTGGMPLIVELGIFLDMLVGALIMGILTFRIKQNFDSIDVAKLNKLRG